MNRRDLFKGIIGVAAAVPVVKALSAEKSPGKSTNEIWQEAISKLEPAPPEYRYELQQWTASWGGDTIAVYKPNGEYHATAKVVVEPDGTVYAVSQVEL